MTFDSRVSCSSISFRALPLLAALDVISCLGFEEIDLGALPGLCDHVPYELTANAVRRAAGAVDASGLSVRSVNGDVGDLNALLDAGGRVARDGHLSRLLELAACVGARALVLPCGALAHEPRRTLAEDLDLVAAELGAAAMYAASFGVQLWTESLHFLRLCWNAERAPALHQRLDPVGVVVDFSHVTASGGDAVDFVHTTGDRIRHVHLRDARPGDAHVSVGRGVADFAGDLAALREHGYTGHVTLELETRDVDDADRPAAALAAAHYVSNLL